MQPFVESRGAKMSANEDFITVETYVQGQIICRDL